ncbi:MAG: DeoR/GlpR family DNA-binding transcription regulator [Spirochaetales bacterium]|nr:DeoR/GlpR family DNA-binding transcription regulator [Spirochaetales bacterium]
MSVGLIPAGRRAGILSEVKEKGFASVEELSDKFDVSVITIRRDLDILETEGEIERTHGGAIYSHQIKTESSYIEKNMQNHEVKAAIGSAASKLVEHGETVFVNSGSTTYQIIKHLFNIPKIRIITNNITAVQNIDAPLDCELIFVGGLYRFNSGCTVGNFAYSLIEKLNVSKTFIGADGISLKNGITSPVEEEAAITRKMIEHTLGDVIVAADSSKVGLVSTFYTASLEKIDYLVTDSNFDETYRPDFVKSGIKIIKAEK